MPQSSSNPRAQALVAAVLAVGLTFTFGTASAPAGAQEKSVWDGVFTEEQAARGETAYEQECASCHLADLLGDGIAPALIGPAFDFRWSDLSVGSMFESIRATMPQGAPASLSPQGYSDIVAYMLQRNDFPTGDMELPTATEELETIMILAEQP